MDPRTEELVRNLDKYLIGLDDAFQFRCRGCGKYCKHREDILLTARDLFNIAKKLALTPQEVVEQYCHAYIGSVSRVPLIRLLPQGESKTCPLLRDKRCLVHDAKPAVCALFPLGRTIQRPVKHDESFTVSHEDIRYILQPTECGSKNRTQTVRSWLERFGLSPEDTFYLRWNATVMWLADFMRELEERKTPHFICEMAWNLGFSALYFNYDTAADLLTQFDANIEKLKPLLGKLEATADAALKEMEGTTDG